MPTLQEINEQIKNLDGFSRFFGKMEIKELPKILWEDEKIEKLVQGTYDKDMGILVATNKRLIFINKGIFKLKVEDFPYDKISSIQYEMKLLFGEITIYTSGNRAEIEQIQKDHVRSFCEYVRARITSITEHKSSKPETIYKSSHDDIIEKLERLATLKEQGILTEEEFVEQKKRILA